MVRIAIDAMGGDYAPAEQVKGAVLALEKQKDLFVYLCGDEQAVKAELSKYTYDESRVEIVHTTEIITNEEEPAKAVKAKKDSSTVVAFRLVKDGKADGVVSSGSTGAVLSCGVLIWVESGEFPVPVFVRAFRTRAAGSPFFAIAARIWNVSRLTLCISH